MTTITIDNEKINSLFSKEELEFLILDFLENTDFSLNKISINELSERSKERLKNINSLNFI